MPGHQFYRKYGKRCCDLTLATIGLPFFVALSIPVATAIKLEDQGPVFYNAPRLGKNGKIFKMYKFRSMKVNAPDIRNKDGSTFNAKDDPRLTKVGKFIRKTSIDETPQLLNVLKGDMSLVGPRPDLPDALRIYSNQEKNKLKVKPGITGYCQAYFRNSIDLKKRFEKDLYYAEYCTLLLDTKIVLKTIQSVCMHNNIYRNEVDWKIKGENEI